MIGNYTAGQQCSILEFIGEKPFIAVGKLNFLPEGYDTVSYDAHGALVLALDALRKANVKNFLFVEGKDMADIPFFYQKITSINAYINEHPEMHLESFIQSKDFGSDYGYMAIKEYLEQGGIIPEGIFTANDPLAIGVIKGLTKKGYKIGSQISLVSINGDNVGEWTTPRLTSVDIKAHQMGIEAVALLHQKIDFPSSEPRFVSFKPVLVERDSIWRKQTTNFTES